MFKADAVTAGQFKTWARNTLMDTQTLTIARYNKLIKPSTYVEAAFYSNPAANIFNLTIDKYMMPNYRGAVQ